MIVFVNLETDKSALNGKPWYSENHISVVELVGCCFASRHTIEKG